MPATTVHFYADDDGTSPPLEWLDEQSPKVQDKLRVRLEQLEDEGHQLRRPVAAPLRDGIHELRVGWQRVNYRLLYFFHGRDIAVVAHGLTKERAVPAADIDRAVRRRDLYHADPAAHTWTPDAE